MSVQRVEEFDTWRPDYGNAIVEVLIAGTQSSASVFLDELLTVPASNPQILDSRVVNSIDYGKFHQPIYTSQPYYLRINNAENTGVIRPGITNLDGEDADDAQVTPTGGSVARDLDDLLAEVFYAENYGVIGAVAATNTATIAAAIGAAAAAGGGAVILPAGSIPFNQLSLSTKVILEGRGRETTVLVSTVAGNAMTFDGDACGLRRLTLDGSILQAASVGVFSKSKDETIFDDVLVKRFETCLYFKGGQRANWQNLYIDNAVNGAKLHGDLDTGNGSDGDEFRNNEWNGGRVTTCTAVGVELNYVDRKIWHNRIHDVGFESNTGTALNIVGARHVHLAGCWWVGNTTNLVIADAATLPVSQAIGVHFDGGSMSGGAATLTGTVQDIIFDKMEISNVAFTLTTPSNNVLLRDCIEDDNVTFAGIATRIVRVRTINGDDPTTSGLTTGNAATKSWSYKVAPGQVGWVDAKIVGVARNTADYATYHIKRPFRRPGSILLFDGQVGNFTLGDIVTGTVTGAKGRLIAQTDAGATGSLTLRDIVGEFVDNEGITSNTGGNAFANGVLSHQAVALLATSFIDPVATTAPAVVDSTVETDAAWDVVFIATAEEVEIHVTGNTGKTIDWIVDAQVVVN